MTMNEEIPNAAVCVHTGCMDVEGEYLKEIDNLNRWTPTAWDAQRRLEKMGIGSDLYDQLVIEGEYRDDNHTLRSLIAIVRGDQRLLGDIYHEIRIMSGDEIGEEELNKARGMASRSDPNRGKSPYFS